MNECVTESVITYVWLAIAALFALAAIINTLQAMYSMRQFHKSMKRLEELRSDQ